MISRTTTRKLVVRSCLSAVRSCGVASPAKMKADAWVTRHYQGLQYAIIFSTLILVVVLTSIMVPIMDDNSQGHIILDMDGYEDVDSEAAPWYHLPSCPVAVNYGTKQAAGVLNRVTTRGGVEATYHGSLASSSASPGYSLDATGKACKPMTPYDYPVSSKQVIQGLQKEGTKVTGFVDVDLKVRAQRVAFAGACMWVSECVST